MITKVLLVDPSIGFAVGIKRALEQPGGYKVMTFANGQAALDLVREEPQDVAILDFEPDDMDIVSLIAALREIQPDLPILVSPRTNPQVARLPSLDIQGSINKPYLVRQLIPAIRDVMAAQARSNAAASSSALQLVTPAPTAEAIESTPPPEPVESVEMAPPVTPIESTHAVESPSGMMDTPSMGVPIMHGSDDFDAALAALTLPSDDDVFVTPDDTFHRHLSAMQANAPITTAGLRKTLENFAMPPTDEDSTLAEAIGVTASSAADLTAVPILSVADALAAMPHLVGKAERIDLTDDLNYAAEHEAAYSIEYEAETDHGAWYSDDDAATEPIAAVDLSAPPPIPAEAANIEPSFVAALTAVNNLTIDLTENAADADIDSAAEIAARLTHLAMQSTAYATILTRAGALVASAGDLSGRAVAGVVETIAQIWQIADDDDMPSDDPSTMPPRIRYIQVPGVGDFALYSIRTIDALYLSVLFPADTSLRLIRQQARRLIAALEQGSVGTPPETVPGDDEPAAAKTLLSRPTEPMVPNGLRDVIAAQGIDNAYAERPADRGIEQRDTVDDSHAGADFDPVDQIAPPPQPPPTLVTIPDVPYSPYTLMWLPRTESALMDIADLLPGWIHTVAGARAWKVSESTVSAGCVSVRIDLPADQTPGGAIDALQRATAERANEADLWSDAYYVIASERAVTPDEIAMFVDYRRPAGFS